MKVFTQHEYEHDIEGLVAAACRLVGSDHGVRSVHVLTPSRPTYDELWCYQEWAHDQHVRLNVDGTASLRCGRSVTPRSNCSTDLVWPHLPRTRVPHQLSTMITGENLPIGAGSASAAASAPASPSIRFSGAPGAHGEVEPLRLGVALPDHLRAPELRGGGHGVPPEAPADPLADGSRLDEEIVELRHTVVLDHQSVEPRGALDAVVDIDRCAHDVVSREGQIVPAGGEKVGVVPPVTPSSAARAR